MNRKEYLKRYYQANKERYVELNAINRDLHRRENKKYLLDLLGGKCIKCNSIINLEFHHIDPSTKLFNVLQNLHFSLSRLIDEAKKCQLLCFDCHNTKHRKKVKVDDLDRTTDGRNKGI